MCSRTSPRFLAGNGWIFTVAKFLQIMIITNQLIAVNMKKTLTFLGILMGLLSLLESSTGTLQAQNIIGGANGDASAILDLQSSSKGLLIPRMTSTERSAVSNPAAGLMIYNMTLSCVEINIGSSSSPDWLCLAGAGKVASVDCGGAVQTGSLVPGTVASGVSVALSYTGGNGNNYGGQTVTSTGVTGLTATLGPGAFAGGGGSLTYTISGTPSAAGTASFALVVGGQTCVLGLTVALPVGVITALDCAGATTTGTLTAAAAASSVSVSVPYTGGNGGTHSGQTVTSTGVTGLTATLTAGTFASGSGSLEYAITGTPSAAGTASFALSIGGQSCTLAVTVGEQICSAFVASGVSKVFMCHNLGANTSADPLTPSWELNGNYYQWGRNPTCLGQDGADGTNPCSSPVYGAAAPWGNTTGNDNAGAITGWSTTPAANGAWADGSKTVNDPCPAGFRIPTAAQWTGVINATLNPRTFIGSFTGGTTNYSSGIQFGSSLFLPAAGFRGTSNGTLFLRGSDGYYWGSGASGSNGQSLVFVSSIAVTSVSNRNSGFSLRCIAE
jgi:hypothetical protein